MQIFVNTKYNFVKWRFHAVAFSLIWMIVGAAMFVKHGVNWGIDFAVGANIVLKFKGQVPVDRLRSLLTEATIQQYGKAEDNTVLIRLPEQKKESDYAGNTVQRLNVALNPEAASGKVDLNFRGRGIIADLLYQADPDHKGTNADARKYYETVAQNIISKRSELGRFTNMQQVVSVPGITTGIAGVLNGKTFIGAFNVLNQETVGPQVGRELQQKAVWAIVLSTLAMGAYLWIRFDIMFGAAAVVCIVHDVAMSLAFLGLINGEASLDIVAALLL